MCGNDEISMGFGFGSGGFGCKVWVVMKVEGCNEVNCVMEMRMVARELMGGDGVWWGDRGV